jgi:signal peptidase II
VSQRSGTPRWNRRLALLVSVIVAADWLTKFIVLNQLELYERVALVGSWLSIVHVSNDGIAFSLLSDASAAWRLPLLIVTVAVALVLLVRMASAARGTGSRLSRALIMAGALGNLGDRILDGGVTDFLVVRFFPYIFNIADVEVTIGGTLLAIVLIRRHTPVLSSPH